jgi:hypothetical protein
MEPTVVSGPVEFSPADIAAIIAVLAALFIAVTAPGWLVLAIVAGQRPATTPGRRWAMRVGGGLAGLAICAAAAALLAAVGAEGFYLGIVGGWAVCWLLAARMRRRAPRTAPAPPEGWGR